MNSQEEKDGALRSYPQGSLESPFLEEELFAGESEAGWEARLRALEAETPFARILKQGACLADQPEVQGQEFGEDEEEPFPEVETNIVEEDRPESAEGRGEDLEWETDDTAPEFGESYEEEDEDEDLEEPYEASGDGDSREEDAEAYESEGSLGLFYEDAVEPDLEEPLPLFFDAEFPESKLTELDLGLDGEDLHEPGMHGLSDAQTREADLRATSDLDFNEDSEIDTEQETPFRPEAEAFTEEVWSGSSDQVDFRDRVLAAHIARSRKRGGAPEPNLKREQLQQVEGTKISMRRDAAEAASKMLGAARSDLASAQVNGHPDALKTSVLTATSGYRSSDHQRRLWLGYFKNYYKQTQSAREALPDGPHSDQAITYMLEKFGIPKRIAAPGYSNHQGGIAIDLKQQRSSGPQITNSYNSAAQRRWRATWFYAWLEANAARFGFKPYKKEAWHWEYKPSPDPNYPAPQDSRGNALRSLPRQLSEAVRKGLFSLQVALSILSGQRDEDKLTNMIFFARHPELPRGYKIAASEKALASEWIDIRNNSVRPVLRALQDAASAGSATAPSASTTTSVSSSSPALPAIKRRGRGYVSYGGGRLLTTLRRLKTEGRLPASDADLETLQKMSEVESGGALVSVQTYDSAYLSFGFLQYTILWGELQELIRQAPAAFARYGISLEGRYLFKKRTVPGIRGAARASDLRSRDWVERFLRAALDDDVIIAQVAKGLEDVAKQTRRLQRALGSRWSGALASPRVRALLAETYNNRPIVIRKILPHVASRFPAGGNEPLLVQILTKEILRAYAARGEAEKGRRLTTKILRT